MKNLITTTRREQDRGRRRAGYAVGVAVETAAVCLIMLLAFAVSYAVVVLYR